MIEAIASVLPLVLGQCNSMPISVTQFSQAGGIEVVAGGIEVVPLKSVL